MLAKDLGYLKEAEYEAFNEQLIEIKKMLTGLIDSAFEFPRRRRKLMADG